MLKKPLHTSIAVEMDEFDDIKVVEDLRVIISVKDFRSILQHANWTSNELRAAYSRPGRPMKISYNGDGIICEFILMTVNDKSASAAQKKDKAQTSDRPAPRPSANPPSSSSIARAANNTVQARSPEQQQHDTESQQARMPPPRRPNPPRLSQFDIRAPLKQPPSTLKSDSLFLPQPDEDEDEQWQPVNPDDEDDEDENARLGWDTSNQPVSCCEIHALGLDANQGCRPQPCASATISITIRKTHPQLWTRRVCPRRLNRPKGSRMFANSNYFPSTSRHVRLSAGR